jgi:hypothetical protein
MQTGPTLVGWGPAGGSDGIDGRSHRRNAAPQGNPARCLERNGSTIASEAEARRARCEAHEARGRSVFPLVAEAQVQPRGSCPIAGSELAVAREPRALVCFDQGQDAISKMGGELLDGREFASQSRR